MNGQSGRIVCQRWKKAKNVHKFAEEIKKVMLIELSGRIERIIYTNKEGGYTIAKVKVFGQRDLITVVGILKSTVVGEILKMKGEWVNRPKYGEEFRVLEYNTTVSEIDLGIKKKLESGVLEGMEPVVAGGIVQDFEEKTQVKKLDVLDEWIYTEEWLKETYGDPYEKDDRIRKALKSEDGSFYIRSFIYEEGPRLAPVQRHINRFIDMVNNGIFDDAKDVSEKLNFVYRLESLPNHLLILYDEEMDRLQAHNYQKAPEQILKIIDKIDKEYRKAKETFDALVKQLRDIVDQESQKPIVDEFRRQLYEQMQMEMTQSKVREGMVYVLTNDSMPGVVKIGFTAGNPDKRASYISEQYALPSPFVVEGYVRTKDPYIVEQRVHVELADCRVRGEFFKISPNDALEVIRKYMII